MRCTYLALLLAAGCTTPVPSQIKTPETLDGPLELIYTEDVDTDDLDSLELVHDGVKETGRIEASGKSLLFFPEHGWFAGAKYAASLDGLDPFEFTGPATWHLLGESSGACGEDTWDPIVKSTLDGRVLVLASGDHTSCLLERTATGYTSRPIGTHASDSYSQGTMELSEDGAGFVIHMVDTKTELVDLAGGAPLVLGSKTVRAAGSLTNAAHGLVVRGTDRYETADPQRLVIRTVDPALKPGEPLVIGPEVEVTKGSDMIEVTAAANDKKVRAVGYIRWDGSPTTAYVHVAITRDDKTWKIFDLRSGDPNALRSIQLAIADDGWVYATWHEELAGGEQIWSAAYGTKDRIVAPARIDGGATVASRTHERVKSRWGHTAVAWLEKPAAGQVGKVAVRSAQDGVWGPLEYSTDAVHPHAELGMDLDEVGNLAFTWENETLTPCGARKTGATWAEYCKLPAPNFTAPVASVSVNARGRTYVSVYNGRAVDIGAFD